MCHAFVGVLEVDTLGTPCPGSDGSSETNQIRPTGITYPSGRQLEYNYGATGSGTDLFNRVHAVRDGSTNVVEYKYLGGGRIVVADYTEPDLKLDLWGDTPGSYTGLDNFGRVVDQRWVDYAGSPVDAARLQYGYDRDGMPGYRKDTVAHALGAGFDELYGRDGLRRLNDYQRGQLNGTNDAISGGTLTFGQDWSLDQVANQTALNQDSSGGGTDDLVQTRSHNTVNEITGITNTTGGAWSTPAYDAAGNTTRTPYPNNPTAAGEDVVLAYDAWNRVVRLTDAASPAATRNAYTYDARGFRIGNTLLSGAQLDHYYTAGWQCIEDRSNGALESQYVWGLRYVDDLVQRQRDTTGNGLLDETTYALTDTQFNVVALSDTSGNIVQRIAYEPYGQPTFLTASYGASTNTRNWRYLFQGLRRHYGLYDNRNRLYDLLTGRFMQRDPLGYPDGLNAYAAYHVMWGGVDPMGLNSHAGWTITNVYDEYINTSYQSTTQWVLSGILPTYPGLENNDDYLIGTFDAGTAAYYSKATIIRLVIEVEKDVRTGESRNNRSNEEAIFYKNEKDCDCIIVTYASIRQIEYRKLRAEIAYWWKIKGAITDKRSLEKKIAHNMKIKGLANIIAVGKVINDIIDGNASLLDSGSGISEPEAIYKSEYWANDPNAKPKTHKIGPFCDPDPNYELVKSLFEE